MASVTKEAKAFNPHIELPLRKARGYEEVRVTPELAQQWLSYNTSNRAIVNAKVEQFQMDMERGEWSDNGDSIRFAYGKLLDGQHRLTAIVLSGITLRLPVFFGLNPESQVTMDTGRGRTPRDVLSIEGMGKWESAVLGSALHTIIAHEAGLAIYSTRKYTNKTIRDYYLEHSAALNSTVHRVGGYPRTRPLLPHMRSVALHYLLGKVDADDADQFFDRLVFGDGLAKSSPIYQLRERLRCDQVDAKHRSAYEQFHFVVKAWNIHRKDGALKSPTALFPRQGEAFPEIAR